MAATFVQCEMRDGRTRVVQWFKGIPGAQLPKVRVLEWPVIAINELLYTVRAKRLAYYEDGVLAGWLNIDGPHGARAPYDTGGP